MTDIRFYHLERSPLEAALPLLLGKSLERGWRAIVKAASPERIAALDAALWTFAEDSFLPHGRAADPHAADQPILLTEDDANPNAAAALFLVDGAAVPADPASYQRVSVMLDGTDAAAIAEARRTYRLLRESGHTLEYWRQDEAGAWRKQ